MTEDHIMQMHRDGVPVTYKNVADAVGLTHKEVKVILTVAMKKMRRNLPKIMKEMGIKNAQMPDTSDSANLD